MPSRLSRFLGAVALVLMACVPLICQAPSLRIPATGTAIVRLDGSWQFRTGDSAAWSAPALDDSAWEPIAADRAWGKQTHFGYTGFAWYRRHLHFDQPSSLALLLPPITQVYQVFWNGQLIAQHGTMPPHASWPGGDPRQIVTLPAASDGVLAIRVWQPPYLSGDSGDSGGFSAVPLLGTQAAIADRKAAIDFRNYVNRVVNNIISAIPLLMAIFGLISWLQDRSRKVIFWMTIWGLAIFTNGLAANPHLALPGILAIALDQPLYGLGDLAVWFLLLYLLELEGKPRLVRMVRVAAWITLISQILDALDIELLWTGPHVLAAQIADTVTTVPILILELVPVVLIGAALGKRLPMARWLVAVFGASFQLLVSIRNAASQGQRFTHWTLSERLQPLQNLSALLLLFSVIYAVLRFSAEQRAQRNALVQEYKSAQELQRVLIPETLPPLPGYAVTSAYKPAQQVGGDFFQVIAQPGGAALVILGDVSGKGLTAAMTVSLIVGTLRTLAESTSDPAAILAGLNRRLHGRLRHGFATCIVVRIDGSDECTLASAGHLPPFLNAAEIDLPPALPLGLDPEAAYEVRLLRLEVQDCITLYTDGLLEARDPATGELFGFDRLRELLATRPDAAQASDAAVRFGQDDDVTVLTLTRLATGITSTTTLSAPALPELTSMGVYC